MSELNGIYQAKTIQRVLTETKDGKGQVAIEFELTQEGFTGRRITYFGSFSSDKAFEITAKALRTTGWAGIDLSDLSGPLADVSLDIGQEEYEGVTRTKVKWVNPAGGINAKPMEESKRKDFAASMKGKLLAFDQSNPGIAAKAKVSGAAPARAGGRRDEPPPLTDADAPPGF